MISNLEDIKLILDIDGSGSDAYINLIALSCEADFLKIRNADFDVDATGGIEYPSNFEVIVAEMIGYKMFKQKHIGIANERLADWNLQFESTAYGYPLSITTAIEKYTKFI